MTTNNLEIAKKIALDIDGWLTEKEAELLYRLANRCRGGGVIVEVGSWKGKSTLLLGQGSKNSKKLNVYAIDPHTGSFEHKNTYGRIWTFDEFENNIKKAEVEELVVPIVKTSEDAAENFNKPVELIFIDGAHDFESVELDFDLWYPKVIEGGIMAFHDTIGYPKTGPGKVVDKYVFRSNNFRTIKIVDSITFAEKKSGISLKDKLKNRYTFLLKNISEFCLGLGLPKPLRAAGRKIMNVIN